ncbi:hypothetical protein HY491_02945 [Candidatus Woesearchaeota archaeon]|nr:hypothetical protein [Candidatus Woesearchaeota archaeon]
MLPVKSAVFDQLQVFARPWKDPAIRWPERVYPAAGIAEHRANKAELAACCAFAAAYGFALIRDTLPLPVRLNPPSCLKKAYEFG